MFRYYYDANKVGAQIRKIRKENHMTQEELAAELVLSVDSISNYENGKTTCMPEHMMHICEIFNVSIDYILGVSDERCPTMRKDDLKPDELDIVQAYQRLDPAGRERMNAYLRGYFDAKNTRKPL